MRVLHLTTSFSGGAGIAARRICAAQKINGINSTIIGMQGSNGAFLNGNEIVFNRNFKNKLMSTIVTGIQQKIFQNNNELITPISLSTLKISDSFYKEFDLIHIHAFYNLLSMKQISHMATRIPVVITMHDQRFFTGGCHYSFECHGFKNTCSGCPQATFPFRFTTKLSLQKSISFLKNSEDITYITPSQWLADCAVGSILLRDDKINVIANPIPDVYSKLSGHRSKDSRLKIGFFSHNLNNPYKGLETLISAAKILKNDLPIELKLYGHGELPQDMDDLVYSQMYFNDDDSAVKAYNSCDVVVVPSTQDNSPSVITEALMCGVPVISTNIGGIREILHRFSLPTIEPQNPNLLADTILDFSKNGTNYDLSGNARKIYSYKSSSLSHIEIYKNSLLKFKKNSIH